MSFLKKKKKQNDESITKGVQLVTVSEPKSVNAEQFNTIRTNIQFSSVDKEVKNIMVTSSVVSEGKSTIAANLAASFAKAGRKTLLVEADLRRPTVNATLNTHDNEGLTNFLTENNCDISTIIKPTSLNNLFVIISGPVPPNPSELLGSKKMSSLISDLRNQLDIIIYDAPPIIPVTDGQILSAQMDGTVLVVRNGYTEQKDVIRTIELIKQVDGNILGTILNDVEAKSEGYYGYYRSNDPKD